ncbi:hypothetical protein H5410_053705 [Solanum commersonii]|uniref:Uncharacterized protein n=1 Tax=Solanum commersonii TaxID=4109 RepID=A0A9J5X756_SOLCO|nr:hypothetical protein H5410_053705 [Solanum commersonii]
MEIYIAQPIVPPNLVRYMEALGWLVNDILSHFISTYLTLDMKLYLAFSFGLIAMTIRDYGFNHARTYISIVLSLILVIIRLVADTIAVEPPPPVEEAPGHD